MRYYFQQYCLDTDSQELIKHNKTITLTKVQYDLLLFLVQNPAKIFSKEEVFENVWQSKHVTQNSIDQIISKLRKILDSQHKDEFIKTVYAKGVMFVPAVTTKVEPTPNKQVPEARNKYKTILILSVLFGLFFFIWKQTPKNNIDPEEKQSLIFITENNNQDWLNAASTRLFSQLFNYKKSLDIKTTENKPKNLTKKQFITNLWHTNPKLKLIKIRTTQDNNLFNVSLSITGKFKNTKIQIFSHQDLSQSLKQASNWLSKEINLKQNTSNLIPQKTHIVELYMHGLSNLAQNNFETAEHYFKLCLKEKSDFQLARLQLAQVKMKQGSLSKSLALLETLRKNKVYPLMSIEIETMRGDIYDTQGKYHQAKNIYLQVINKYASTYPKRINSARFNLSHTFTLLNEYEKSLEQLADIQKNTNDMDLLAHVKQKQASILLNIGKTKEAKIAAKESLSLFEKQNDLLGKAKIYSTLARIATHQSKYKESLQYLQQALSISKDIDYKLGSGAILNEMIYLLLIQGKYTQAWQANLDMQDIAIEIDYNAMLQITKQYAFDISRAQKKYKQAKRYLKEHLQLAKESKNNKALLRNKVLALDLYLDENKLDKVLILIQEIQNHIDQTKELRLQPRLDKQLGRYYLLTQQDDKAIVILQQAKKQALKTEDGEILIEINNILAEHYIKKKQLQKALASLEESSDYQPLPYPYLLLKSKAIKAQGDTLSAIDLANECKLSAYENWTDEDESYLYQLINSANK